MSTLAWSFWILAVVVALVVLAVAWLRRPPKGRP